MIAVKSLQCRPSKKISSSPLLCCCRRHLSTKRPPPPPPTVTSQSSNDNFTEPNPLLKKSNAAQEYESRHSTGLFGFNTHDGPVPIKSVRKAAAAARLKQQQLSRDDKNQSLIEPTTFHIASVAAKLKQRPRDDESPSLIDPFYTPQQPDQTHLIQGGTPYDNNVGPAYKLTNYGESSVYTLILLRHGESEWNVNVSYCKVKINPSLTIYTHCSFAFASSSECTEPEHRLDGCQFNEAGEG